MYNLTGLQYLPSVLGLCHTTSRCSIILLFRLLGWPRFRDVTFEEPKEPEMGMRAYQGEYGGSLLRSSHVLLVRMKLADREVSTCPSRARAYTKT